MRNVEKTSSHLFIQCILFTSRWDHGMDEGDDKKGDWIEAELRDIALLSGEVKDGIMPMLPSFEKVEGLDDTEKFLFFLNSKREKLSKVCEGIENMNNILDKQENPDNYIWFKIEFHIDSIGKGLCFRIIRREGHEPGNTFTSVVVLSEYKLFFEKIHQSKYQWRILYGELKTFGQMPQEGRWQNKNSDENFYSKKGLGKLLWNIATWAVSLLEINRWEELASSVTWKWAVEYWDNKKIKKYQMHHSRVEEDKLVFIASPNLTKYAHELVIEGLKKIGELKMLEKSD